MRSEIYTLVARMIAGAAVPTRLMDAVLEQLQLKPAQFSEFYYRMQYQRLNNTKGWIFPVMVFELWNNGDEGAKFLVERTMDDYVALLGGMIGKTGQKSVVAALGGGVVKLAPQNFLVEMQRRLAVRCPGAILQTPEFSPSVGAAVIAAFKSGLSIKDYYTKVNINTKVKE
jgi:N-acetylglucosamine kinase-like BadF-type ATPase